MTEFLQEIFSSIHTATSYCVVTTTDLYEIIKGEEEEMRLYVQKYWNCKNMFVFLLYGHKKRKVYSNLTRKGRPMWFEKDS